MRIETIGDCTLYLGNCLDVLPEIRVADCVIADMPYGCTDCDWDTPIDLDAYWTLVHAACADNAAHCLFCQMPFAAQLYQSNAKNYRYDYVYIKHKPSGFLTSGKRPLRAHESVYIFYRRRPVYNPQKTPGKPYHNVKQATPSACYDMSADRLIASNNPGGMRCPTSIIKVKHDDCLYFGKSVFDRHPTQKSVSAITLLARTYTNPGQTILDPFMGSGTTGVAAVQTGRKFVGIEMDERWFDVACRRIEAACKELEAAA